MSTDSQYARHQVDAGLGVVSAVLTTTLPLAYTLGERRVVAGVEYKLVFNAGNSAIAPGSVASPLPLAGAGAYSVTVSTASKSNHHLGAVVCVHATATTGSFFWGAVAGYLPSGAGVIGDVTSVPTGSAFYIGSNGAVEFMPGSVVTGNTVIGVNIGGAATKTITTGAKSGDVLLVIGG